MVIPPLAPRQLALVVVLGLWACGGGGTSGCACPGWTPRPQGSFTGQKLDTAAAVRLSGAGFAALNSNSAQILNLFAPGQVMQVPMSCSIQSMIGVRFAVADQGSFGCTSTTCGRMDGKCDAQDLPQVVNIQFTSLQLAPAAPNLIQAVVTAKVQTGQIFLASESRPSLLCGFSGGYVACSIDFDSNRATPVSNELDINIALTIDANWDKLLTLSVSDIGGMKACGSSGSLPPPQCIDPNDILIAAAGPSCGSFCTGVNISAVKSLLIDQLTKSLKTQLDDALKKANCASCGAGTACPTSPTATAACDFDGGAPDAGTCIDTGSGLCVPAMIGTEGVLDVSQALAAAGAPQGSSLEIALAAGGGSAADISGATIGVRGGFKAQKVATCVAPLTATVPPALPLPDFDLDAPGPYDVAFSLSQQALSQAMFQAQQSGALCLELGQESISLLDSSALSALLPSLGKLTHGDSVPLRIVIRPVNPPTATLGEGTVDSTGKILEPLVRLGWKGVEIDVYARLDDRYARLFTLAADLDLPFGLTLDGCSGVTPVLGDLMTAVSNVQIKNSEMLAEKLDVLKALVPTLLSAAEPTLSQGFQRFFVPDVQGFQIQVAAAKGVGNITGTKTYNHMGLYANLLPASPRCTPVVRRLPGARVLRHAASRATLALPGVARVSVRVDGGFWSPWREVGAGGELLLEHPRLAFLARHVVEVRTPEGALAVIELPRD